MVNFFVQLFKEKPSGHPSLNYFYQKEFLNELTCLKNDLSQSFEPQKIAPIVLLFQSGYLTIKDASSSNVTLGIPNLEVRQSITQIFYQEILNRQPSELSLINSDMICRALAGSDIEEITRIINYALNKFCYTSNIFSSESLLRDIVYNMLSYNNINCRIEEPYLQDRSDQEVLCSNRRFVFEFKLARAGDCAEDLLSKAAAQIKARHYGEVLPKLPTYRYAALFSEELRGVARLSLVDMM